MSINEVEYKPGFPALRLNHPNGTSSAEVLLYGAHIVSWTVRDQSLLFLSDKAVFENGKAIRGGVPLVWPQFGPGQLPQHGFARVKTWQLAEKLIDDDVTVRLHLSEDESTLKIWPHKFQLTVTIRLTSQTLHQEIEVQNTDDHPFDFTALFHTYFTVDDIKTTKVSGLHRVDYLDKVDGGQTKTENNQAIEFTGETDRVYKDGGKDGNPLVINDRMQVIGSSTMPDIVVWNPWQIKAKGAADIGEENYPKFVCVEVGHVGNAVTLGPGQSWRGAHEMKSLK